MILRRRSETRMKNAPEWIAAASAAVVAISIIAGAIAATIKKPFKSIRNTIDTLRNDLHGDIKKVDAKVDGVLKESRNEVKHMQQRLNGLESGLRDRVGWIEGFLKRSTEDPDRYDYNVRHTGRSKPE